VSGAAPRADQSIIYRITLILAGIFIIYVLAHLALYWFYLRPSIRRQEEVYVKQTIDQIQAAFHHHLKDLHVIAEDWSAWDSMYNAAHAWTEEFEQDSFPDSVFYPASVDLIMISDEGGQLLFSKIRALHGQEEAIRRHAPVPEEAEFLYLKGNRSVKALVRTPSGPMYICSYPIIRSDNTGPPRGRLVLGRRIGPDMMESIAEILHKRIQIVPIASLPAGTPFDRPISRLSTDSIILHIPFQDHAGRPLLLIRAEIMRSLFAIAQDSTFLYLILSGALFALLFAVLLLTLGVIVLRRIRRLSQQIDADSRQSAYYECVEDGQDEITILQRSYNKLIRQIRDEEARRQRMEREIILMEKTVTASKVTASILHEINNPIRVVMNCLYALEKDPDSTPRYLELLKKEIRHLGSVTNRLSEFSADGKEPPEEVDLVSALTDTIQSIQAALLPRQDCVISLRGDSGPLWVLAHPSRLREIFFNLLKNACEAMDHAGQISVAVSAGPDLATIRVADEGPGLDTTRLDKIFYPFFSRGKKQGMGLGLSIVHAHVAGYGGRIWVDREYRNGACFVVELPRLNREEGANGV
jgi:signal transduction histidine kinase